jgi:cytochrome c oxidase subunit IV
MNPSIRETLTMARGPILIWVLLILLVGGTYAAAVSSLAPPLRTMIHFLVVAVQVGLIGVFFMNLRVARGLIWFAAVAGLYWLVIMFVLTFNDYKSRPPSSPCDRPGFAGSNSAQCATEVK